ncbi:MAG: class I SAM-dependent methyltransferase [Flavobacteriales bacterium]|nr:class I SAM-dependent methyltransferase [Flavobacteriales bacterium]
MISAKSADEIKDTVLRTKMKRVLDKNRHHYPFLALDVVRKKNLADKTSLQVADLGAGSRTASGTTRTVSSITRGAVKREKYAQLLFRLVEVFQPKHILELGTSLGITTGYLSKANKSARVYTMEGVPSIANVARENFKLLGLDNVQLIEGNFDQTLPELLSKNVELDMVFLDGNHRKEPTLRYFEQVLPHLSNGAVVVVDDIYWSKEMTEAWMSIRSHAKVNVAIDLFEMGIVLIGSDVSTESYTVRY